MSWRALLMIAALAISGCGNAGGRQDAVSHAQERCPQVEPDGPLSPETIQKMIPDPPPILNALHQPDQLRRVLKEGADPSLCVMGASVLALVAMNGDVSAVDLLLDHGARPDRPTDSGGGTPLMIALERGRFDAARRLLERGADPLHKTDGGMTTLHHLAMADLSVASGDSARQLQLARDLIAAGVDVNAAPPRQGATPLFFAVLRNNRPLASLLLDRGADPSLKDRQGLTVLALARKRRYTEIVDLLESRSSRNTPPVTSPR